jgi:putative oxidoreductase
MPASHSKFSKRIESLLNPNIGLLLLRVSLGGLFVLHGINKIQNGVEGMKGMMSAKGLPEFMVYGAYIGEVLAPLLIILGIATRPAALTVAFTMAIAIYVAHSGDLFELGKHGGSMIELPLLYLFGALTLVFTGSGKIGVRCGKRLLD